MLYAITFFVLITDTPVNYYSIVILSCIIDFIRRLLWTIGYGEHVKFVLLEAEVLWLSKKVYSQALC